MENKIEKRRKFIINFIFYTIIVGILYFVFNYLVDCLLPFIISFIIAYLLNPAINYIVSHTPIKNRKFLAYTFTIIIATLIGLIMVLLFYWLISTITNNIHYLPNFFYSEIQPTLINLSSWFNSHINNLPDNLKNEITNLQTNFLVELQNLIIIISKNSVLYLTNLSKKISTLFLFFIFTILATVFTNIDFPNVKNFVINNIPKKFIILAHNIKLTFAETIGKYIKAYLKIMFITFIELFIGFYIIGIQNFILAAILIAIFDILPVLGIGGILIPWFTFAFLSGNIQLGFGLLIIYITVTIVRHFIEPKIVGDQLGLNPLVTLLSIYLGFIWFGITRMLIIPIITNIFLKLYQKGQLSPFINFEKIKFYNHTEDDYKDNNNESNK